MRSPCPHEPYERDLRGGAPARSSEELLVALQRSLKGRSDFCLRCMLRVVQSRLGTPGEGPNDVPQAAAIAHQLRNLQSAELMEAGLKKLESAGRYI